MAAVLVSLSAAAQETYQDTRFVGSDLSGTARYVGMGGAMEALGADISTISTNPAGIGLFRKSQATITAGMISQGDAATSFSHRGTTASIDADKSRASFDQIGFVWAPRSKGNYALNLAFNYHKSRDFAQILSAVGDLKNASQNKLSAIKYREVGDLAWNGVDDNYRSILEYTEEGTGEKRMGYFNATDYLFGQYQHGYIGTYDFCISGNINDRVYLGLTFGLHDVNYHSQSYYTENLQPENSMSEAWENLNISGTGFDVKAGIIFRPVEESPFRVGLYVNTPVFYDLSLNGNNDVSMGVGTERADHGNTASYDFKLYTPWKFGLSLGHTVGNMLALGATYEYSDYGATDNRVIDGGYYDYWYDDYTTTSSSDNAMNDHTKRTLKGVHTLKLGAELRPVPMLALRAGYNYLSSAFEQDGFRDGSIESAGNAYATSTDYTNWKATQRLTLGAGLQMGQFSLDLAYKYSVSDGEYSPFMSYSGATDPADNNIASACDVSNKRHQVMLTLGYRF